MMTKDDVLEALRGHIGRDNGQRADLLVMEITGGHTCAKCERRFRRLVSELREDGIAICAHPSTGYYIAANHEDVESCCEFLRSRAMHSLTIEARLRNITLPDLLGQLRLPT